MLEFKELYINLMAALYRNENLQIVYTALSPSASLWLSVAGQRYGYIYTIPVLDSADGKARFSQH